MNQNLIINIILYSTSLCILFVQVPACSNQGVSYDYINHPYNYGTRRYDIGEKKKFLMTQGKVPDVLIKS